MRLLCVGYRSWALNIYKKISLLPDVEIHIIESKDEFDIQNVKKLNPSKILFYGWSWIVPEDIINNYECFMLHPSDLPKYRGGSPIQNQILDGLTESKLTLFKMTENMDDGPIYGKLDLSLKGEIKDIFKRLEINGYKLTEMLINDECIPYLQNDNEASYCKRRKPEESEITIEDLTNHDGNYLFNKIRCLTDPYPNAFIRTKDGKKLYIKSVKFDENPLRN